jgi:NAD(P)-dependent dehydrogenase (short-subunit alcohol dehydrogenase family)
LAGDVNVVINNAGVSTKSSLLTGPIDDVRPEMETHYFGTLAVTRAFAPIIEANGGGAILNVLSVLSWAHVPAFGAYSAAKAASWAMTDAIRQELAPYNHVAALRQLRGYRHGHRAADQKVDPRWSETRRGWPDCRSCRDPRRRPVVEEPATAAPWATCARW